MVYTSEGQTFQKLQTIASWVAALSVLPSFLTILSERLQRVRKRDNGRIAADTTLTHQTGLLLRRVVRTGNDGATVAYGLIEAGDAGLWTSAALDQLGSVQWGGVLGCSV